MRATAVPEEEHVRVRGSPRKQPKKPFLSVGNSPIRFDRHSSHASTPTNPPPSDLPVAKIRSVSTQYCDSMLSSIVVVNPTSSVSTPGTPCQASYAWSARETRASVLTALLTSMPLGYTTTYSSLKNGVASISSFCCSDALRSPP